MLLKGKVALITGAARGIGRTTAGIMAGEGALVGVADILPEVEETARFINENGGKSTAVVFDISDPEQVAAGVGAVRESLGEIDILVNNAAIVDNFARLTKMTLGAWQREVNVNLTGAFVMIQQVIGPMIDRQWGRIINVSSLAASGGLHKQVAYSSSKAGLLGLTKTVTLEHARDGITCNAVLPGLIGTEQVAALPEEIREHAASMTPSRRLGDVEEVARLITFLASDGGGYINGEEIHVDGGMHLNTTTLSRREIRGSGKSA